MKQSLYKINIAMNAGKVIGPDVAFQITKALTHKRKTESIMEAIEEFEDEYLELLFLSGVLPAEIRETAKEILKKYPEIYYIDLSYTYPYDMRPDRVVLWGDGRVQEYKSEIIFTEIDY